MSKQKRKDWKKRIQYGLAALAAAVFAISFYAFNIEPYRIDEEYVSLSLAKEGESAQGSLRVVLFSDLHLKSDFNAGNLDRIVQAINEQDPDVVIFAGDLYDNYSLYHDDEAVIEAFSQIEARYGKLAVWGNRDYGGGAENAYVNLLNASGFTLLQNSNWYIPLEDGSVVLFTGLDDALLGNPVMPVGTKIYESDLDILILHEPDEYENYLNAGYALTLAGHTHGGQIGSEELSSLQNKSKYWKGLYDFENSVMYVTSGIGTTHISARLGMTPVISVLDLSF